MISYTSQLTVPPPMATYGNRAPQWIREQFALAGADVSTIDAGHGNRFQVLLLLERGDNELSFLMRLSSTPCLHIEARSLFQDARTGRQGMRLVVGFVGGIF